METLEKAVERAVDDIIVALLLTEANGGRRWHDVEAAAARLRKAAREIRQRIGRRDS